MSQLLPDVSPRLGPSGCPATPSVRFARGSGFSATLDASHLAFDRALAPATSADAAAAAANVEIAGEEKTVGDGALVLPAGGVFVGEPDPGQVSLPGSVLTLSASVPPDGGQALPQDGVVLPDARESGALPPSKSEPPELRTDWSGKDSRPGMNSRAFRDGIAPLAGAQANDRSAVTAHGNAPITRHRSSGQAPAIGSREQTAMPSPPGALAPGDEVASIDAGKAALSADIAPPSRGEVQAALALRLPMQADGSKRPSGVSNREGRGETSAPRTTPLDATAFAGDVAAQASSGLKAPLATPTESANLNAPSSSTIGIATAPASALSAAPLVEARSDAHASGQAEAALDQLAGAREGQRNLRPEVNLRHGEFGLVNLRFDASGESLRATLTARDPGFVPAVTQALAERGGLERVLAPEQAGLPLAQRVQESTGGTGTGAAGTGSQGSTNPNPGHNSGQGSGQWGGHSEGRYGSSPGSDQGSPQPYSARSRDEGREARPVGSDSAETGDEPGSERGDRGRGLYA